ncbi:Vvs1 protein [Saccharomycopsis crataegensis]|uniref:Vvs1 protein n=1 Tax=Saccharomycopsis crataegensis TaxID=43959 RepID=A0AAV5QU88_9ASCO|nr:Vvs1 protein [Saccharomycopsis crataegensis]
MTSGYTTQSLLSTAVACLGSLQYGYHMAELNAPEAVLSCRNTIDGPGSSWFVRHEYLSCIPLDTSEIGLVTSIFSIGGLIGSMIASPLSDKFGRKNSSFINTSFFIVGSLFEAFSNTKSSLVLGRFISGLGAGTSIVNTPLFINEIATHDTKGFLGSLNQFSVNVGILFTQLLAINWANTDQWRYLLFMGFIIAAANIVGLSFVDESPKWLVKHNEIELAKKSLRALRNPDDYSDEQIANEISQWIAEMSDSNPPGAESQSLLPSSNIEPKSSNVTMLKYLMSSEFYNSRLIVSIIMIGQQLCGINSIIFYGVSIISSLLPQYAVLLNCAISLLNVGVTYVAAVVVDRAGRRPLLIGSVSIMGIACLLTVQGIVGEHPYVTVFAIFSYIAAFAMGLGPIPFLLISEVTQLQATTVAQSFGTVLNWMATFLVGYLFPILNLKLGGYVFGIFGISCAVVGISVWKLFPETRGKKNYGEVWGVAARLD